MSVGSGADSSEDNMIVRCTIACVTLLSTCGFAASAAAEEVKVAGQRIHSVAVSYERSALTGEAAAHDLLDRLNDAAFKACGGDPRHHSFYRSTPDLVKAVFRECQNDAVARAVAEVGSPQLARLHAAGNVGERRAGRDGVRQAKSFQGSP